MNFCFIFKPTSTQLKYVQTFCSHKYRNSVFISSTRDDSHNRFHLLTGGEFLCIFCLIKINDLADLREASDSLIFKSVLHRHCVAESDIFTHKYGFMKIGRPGEEIIRREELGS